MDIDNKLSQEELQQLLSDYKKDLALLYRKLSPEKIAVTSQSITHKEMVLKKIDIKMRQDIATLKKKYGIHY